MNTYVQVRNLYAGGRAGQRAHLPAFQAGHAGSIPVARSIYPELTEFRARRFPVVARLESSQRSNFPGWRGRTGSRQRYILLSKPVHRFFTTRSPFFNQHRASSTTPLPPSRSSWIHGCFIDHRPSSVARAGNGAAISWEVLLMANAVEPSESTLSGGELVGIHNDTFRRVVVPVCCLGSSDEALKVAKLVCRSSGGALRLVHVRTWDEHPPSAGRYFTETSEQATALLEKAVTKVWDEGLAASGIVLDAPRRAGCAGVARGSSRVGRGRRRCNKASEEIARPSRRSHLRAGHKDSVLPRASCGGRKVAAPKKGQARFALLSFPFCSLSETGKTVTEWL